ncbi:MAG: hypothetical protein OXG79_07485 [Chloroflexi bacterium]|nr:hypothetical protein [Chloroflexota bacterium]MCY4111767.1 hypothetical protein [Chloroflexota bacterium]
MIETIVFFVIVGTIVLGVGLDLGYRLWRVVTRRNVREAPTAVAPELPVDDA